MHWFTVKLEFKAVSNLSRNLNKQFMDFSVHRIYWN